MRHQSKDFRARSGRGIQGRLWRMICGMLSRQRITDTSGARWATAGFIAGADNAVEIEDAENFPNIGFAARPIADARAECIVGRIGSEDNHPVIIATRDYDGVKVLLSGEGLEAGDTVVFNRASMVKVKADGEILVGTIGGTFAPLATKADIDALAAHVDTHTHVTTAVTGGGGPVGVISAPTATSPAATGTQKLKAE